MASQSATQASLSGKLDSPTLRSKRMVCESCSSMVIIAQVEPLLVPASAGLPFCPVCGKRMLRLSEWLTPWEELTFRFSISMQELRTIYDAWCQLGRQGFFADMIKRVVEAREARNAVQGTVVLAGGDDA